MRLLSTVLILAIASPALAQSDWPQWRGPNGSGGVAGGSYPVKWDATSGLAWKTPLPGKGCSTPIVWHGRIFLTAGADGQDSALAFDTSGKLLWQTRLGAERKGKHRNGSGSNSSPATDGQGVFVYFKSGTLARLELDGKVTWKINLQDRFGHDTLWWDVGTSPVLTARDVVVAVMHQGNSYLAAFDKTTGQLHWKTARDFTTPLEGDHSYTTPLLFRHAGRDAVLVWGAVHLTAYDADDGRLLWSCGDFNPDGKSNWVAVSSPVLAGKVAVVPYGRGNTLHGIRLDGSGDVTATHRQWKRDDSGSFVPTPAYCQGRVYVLRDKGELHCIDPASGKTLASGQLPESRSKYYASPLVAGGHIYAAREDGVVFVARADAPMNVMAENRMDDRLVASPVPLDGRLLLRGEKFLYCIAAKQGTASE
jgi:outer membrane protein assembly factor BamB